jgi:photosystem II stability/assembly factor-like uncharacterized protein
MKKYILYFCFLTTYNLFSQWIPSIEKTQTGIGDILVTANNRIILNNLEEHTVDGTMYMKYSDDNGLTWRNVKGVELPNYSSLGALAKQGSNIFAYSSLGIWKSKDNGQIWNLKNHETNYSSYMRRSAVNDKFIVLANSHSDLLFSQDQGETWTSSSVPTYYISGIDIRTDTLFVSAQSDVYQGIFRNNEWKWTKIPVTPDGWANDFTGIAAPDGNTIIVTSVANGGVFISKDRGKTWETPVITNAQGIVERSFEDISILGNYWILTSTQYSGRVFISTDKGKTWTDFSAGLPSQRSPPTTFQPNPIYKINIQNGMLFAAIGNSLWKRPISEFTPNYLETPTFLKANTEKRNTHIIEWQDNSTKETGFIVERAENAATGFKEITRLAANAVSFIDYDIAGGKTYFYRLKAFNATTTSRYSEVLKVERLPNVCKVEKKAVYHNGFSSLAFMSDKVGFAFRADLDKQTLMKTEDGGVSWRDIEQTLIEQYGNIHFLDTKTGIIIGPYADTLLTSDGGITWKKLQKKYPSHLKQYNQIRKSIPFYEFYVNDSTGFRGVSTYSNTFDRTGDYGKSWISVKTEVSVEKVYFTNSKVGFFYETNGKIAKTTDGGDSWQYLTLPVVFNQLKDMYSLDGKILYFAGNTDYDDVPVIIRTSDAGSTFETIKVKLPNAGGVKSISMAGTKTWLSTTNHELYVSEDGLKTWKILSHTPITYGSTFSFKGKWGLIGSVDYSDEAKLMAYMTYDGGHTWQDIRLPSKAGNVFSCKVKIFTDNNAAVLAEDIIYKTTDKGKNWTSLKTPFARANGESGFIYQYKFVNENVWYITHSFGAGDEYKLYKTTDGGKTWEHVFQIASPYEPMYFFNENIGFIKENGPAFYKTTNGGKSWNRFDSQLPLYYYPNSMWFTDTNNGFMVGGIGSPIILQTSDGGNTWKNVVIDKSLENIGSLHSVKFLDKNIGYIIGDNKLIKTTDAGKTWSESGIENVLTQHANLVNFDDYYFGASQTNQLLHYEAKMPSAKPHEPNGVVDACLLPTEALYEVDNNNEYSYQWKLSGGGTLLANRNEAKIKWNALGTYKLSVKATNDCGESDWQETTITVRALANKPTLTSGELNPCPSIATTYKLNTTNGYTYDWFFPTTVNGNKNKNEALITFYQDNKIFKIKAIAKDTYCPSDTLSFDVKTKLIPTVPLISYKNNFLISNSLNSNQWLLEGTPVKDATKQTFTPQTTGNYSVKVSNECGSNISLPFFITITITAAEPEFDSDITVYPNPSNDFIFIKTEFFPIEQVQLYNNNGQLVRQNTESEKNKILVQDLNSGVYLLKIQLKNQIIHRKVVIDK